MNFIINIEDDNVRVNGDNIGMCEAGIGGLTDHEDIIEAIEEMHSETPCGERVMINIKFI